MKLFLDTNVIMDYIGKRGDDGVTAELLQLTKAFGDADLVVSAKSYTDVFFTLRRYMDTSTLQQAILDTLSLYQVCAIDADDIAAACQMGWDDFEDALITVAAEKCGADYLITRDVSFRKARVPLLTPQGFFDLMREMGITYSIVSLDD
ncbi:MAG: PIN domain-containing protein [Coriobacteriia bacterium]|nr:PIN domain-containing protein [Coriobacteriia bacterium]